MDGVPSGAVGAEADSVVSAAIAAASRHGAEWFPHLDPKRFTVQVAGQRNRPRCLLVRLRLYDDRQEAAVVVKSRHQRPATRGPERSGTRPTLMVPEPLPEAEMAQREYDGLRMIAAGFGSSDSARFGIGRPLAWLPAHAAFVMDHVADPTLRHRLMARSRLRPGSGRPAEDAWVNAGAWLRIYHGLRPAGSLQTRNDQRSRLVELFDPYAEFLAEQTGHPAFFRALARDGAAQAEAALPTQLPLVVGHGDFVVRNLFESPSGRITVIDPMPRWLVPPHQDLVRFVVGMRMLGLQIVSQGLAFGQRQLDAYEAAFLCGYFGADPVPMEQLRMYQLLIVLDKWAAALKPARRGRPGQPAPGARQRWSDRYFRRELRRLSSPASGG